MHQHIIAAAHVAAAAQTGASDRTILGAAAAVAVFVIGMSISNSRNKKTAS